jgi:hypothetical protein
VPSRVGGEINFDAGLTVCKLRRLIVPLPSDRFTFRRLIYCKRKGKGHPITGHEGSDGEKRYTSTLYLISALDVVGGQRHAPAALPPGKTRYLLYRRLGGPQGRSGQVRKISPPPGIYLRTV